MSVNRDRWGTMMPSCGDNTSHFNLTLNANCEAQQIRQYKCKGKKSYLVMKVESV